MKIKKYLFKLLLLLLVLFFGNSVVTAQSTEGDLKKIGLKYNGVKKLMMSQEINYYDSYTAKSPIETNNTILSRSDGQIHSKAFNQETIIRNGISMWIDHEAKIMVLNQVDETEIKNSFELNLKGLETLSYKTDYLEKGKFGCYVFHFKVGEHTKSEIFYNKETYEIKKIVYYLRDPIVNDNNLVENNLPPRIEIKITDFNTDYEFNDSVFSFEQFILIADNEILLSSNYKDYQLINNIRN